MDALEKSGIPLVECSDVIRKHLLKCIAPADLLRMVRVSETASRLTLACPMELIIDAVYHRGTTTFTLTSPEGVTSECLVGRDILEVLKAYRSYRIRTVRIKWGVETGKRGYRSIFNSFYFLPDSLQRFMMEQGSMRFLCDNLIVESEVADHENIEKMQHALHCFKINWGFELDGELLSYQDILYTPSFTLHKGESLKETDFLMLTSRYINIVLRKPEKTWRLNDFFFNMFLRKWQEGQKDFLKYLEVGSDVRKPGPVEQFRLDILVCGLDAKLTKFGSKKFLLKTKKKKKISCRGGWDIESNDGEIGTILRTYGKFTFIVWARDELDQLDEQEDDEDVTPLLEGLSLEAPAQQESIELRPGRHVGGASKKSKKDKKKRR